MINLLVILLLLLIFLGDRFICSIKSNKKKNLYIQTAITDFSTKEDLDF